FSPASLQAFHLASVRPCGTAPGNTYEYRNTISPTIEANAMECQIKYLRMLPSLPTWFVAAVATTIDCTSIILPMTPPALFAAHIRIGSSPSCSAVIRCNPPNRAFEDVSLPVRATPSHPRNVPKNGNKTPVLVKASPSTASMPEYRVMYPSPSMNDIAITAAFIRFRVCQKIASRSRKLSPNNKPAVIPASRHPVPVADSQLNSNFADSGDGCETTGLALVTARSNSGTLHPPRSNAGIVHSFIADFIPGRPQTSTNPDNSKKGIHARAILLLECPLALALVAVPAAPAEVNPRSTLAPASSPSLSSNSALSASAVSRANLHTRFGCQNLRNA